MKCKLSDQWVADLKDELRSTIQEWWEGEVSSVLEDEGHEQYRKEFPESAAAFAQQLNREFFNSLAPAINWWVARKMFGDLAAGCVYYSGGKGQPLYRIVCAKLHKLFC